MEFLLLLLFFQIRVAELEEISDKRVMYFLTLTSHKKVEISLSCNKPQVNPQIHKTFFGLL